MTASDYDDRVSRRPKPPPTPMAAWVRRVREAVPLSHDDFSEALNVHRTTVVGWERGKGQRVANIDKIRKAFPNAPPPPFAVSAGTDSAVDAARSMPPAEQDTGGYKVKSEQGRIVGMALDAIKNKQERTRAMRKCLEALDPSQLAGERPPGPAQRK